MKKLARQRWHLPWTISVKIEIADGRVEAPAPMRGRTDLKEAPSNAHGRTRRESADNWPGFDEVERLVDLELDAQLGRADAIDNKAGLTLGAAGVLVGLTAQLPHRWPAFGAVAFALAAAVAALWSLAPRSFPAIGPREVRKAYLGVKAAELRYEVLDTKTVNHERTEKLLQEKVFRLKVGLVLLLGAISFVAISVVLGEHGLSRSPKPPSQQPHVQTTTSTPNPTKSVRPSFPTPSFTTVPRSPTGGP